MKKFKKSLTLICLTLLFLSCSEDDPIGVNTLENQLVGTWKLTEITQEGTTTTDLQGVPITSDFTSEGKNINAQVTFTQNPNNFTSSGNYTSVVTITFLGQGTTQEIPVQIDDFLNQGTWSINGSELTITQNSEAQTAIITEITDTTLKFEIEVNQEVVAQGITSTTETTAKMSLTKQ